MNGTFEADSTKAQDDIPAWLKQAGTLVEEQITPMEAVAS